MAPIAWSDVVALPNAAALSTVSDAAQTMILNIVNTDTPDPDNYDGEDGPVTKMARCLVAAHFGQGIVARTGLLASDTEGDLSESFSYVHLPANVGAAWWMTTGFGLAYWQLRQGSLARIPWVP